MSYLDFVWIFSMEALVFTRYVGRPQMGPSSSGQDRVLMFSERKRTHEKCLCDGGTRYGMLPALIQADEKKPASVRLALSTLNFCQPCTRTLTPAVMVPAALVFLQTLILCAVAFDIGRSDNVGKIQF